MVNTSSRAELEMLKVCGQNVSLLCPAGFASARRIWVDYATGADGILFVVDAADEERLSEAAEALEVRTTVHKLDMSVKVKVTLCITSLF